MSFFNKMLARVGVGAAKIDTVLEQNEYTPNSEVRGVVYIEGGNVDQAVGSIYIEVMTRYTREQDDKKQEVNYTIARHRVADSGLIKSGEKVDVPFSFLLPAQTPLTLKHQKVWLHTGLDIEMSVDPTDQDYISVRPHPYMSTVLDATELLGFRFKDSTVEYASRAPFGVPYVQEIEFYPGPQFNSRVSELELMMAFRGDGLQVLVEVDRRGRGLSGFFANAFEMDERHSWLDLSKSELERGAHYVADRLAEIIHQSSR
ncbi:sporulation protein [Paenibacillus campi]|uniref:sporulation protein n=1 Tax=Paenibacillus campi TaxID=3106031 RepID=UPI002AFFADB4|nr:sporulation protein [Paenibacillus sp. SGZ-1014]